MAHKLDTSKGFVGFVSYEKPAWHGLGQIFTERISTAQALEHGGLDFEVAKIPNIHAFPNGLDENGEMKFEEVISKESFFTMRTDVSKILGAHVGKDYTVFQNRDCFAVIDQILEKGTAHIETAGVIDEGRKVFICLAVNESIMVGDSDRVEQYVLVTSSHDGSMAITATPTNVRVVCNNTLTAALRGAKGAIKIRHSQRANERLEDAARVLRLISDNTHVNEDNYNKMRETIIDENKLMDYFGSLFFTDNEIKLLQVGKADISTKKENIIKDVLSYGNRGVGQLEALMNGNINTWFAYNAVTGYLTRKRYKSANDRAKNMLFAGGAELIQKAGVLALEPEKIQVCRRLLTNTDYGFSNN